ncbi:MAG: DNA-binding MarR family transcriptional regulator [Bacteroidia bacterium]|jgi:DNA-binding MarR family transcriptional regulator
MDPLAADHVYRGNAERVSLLARYSDHLSIRLMELVATNGHEGLRTSFESVLPHIGPKGARIPDIAAIRGVTKQAVSALAQELKDLGYAQKNKNGPRLTFSAKGISLITDFVSAIEILQDELRLLIGKKHTSQIIASSKSIYDSLNLSEIEFGTQNNIELDSLADSLIAKYGSDDARVLAKFIHQKTSGK